MKFDNRYSHNYDISKTAPKTKAEFLATVHATSCNISIRPKNNDELKSTSRANLTIPSARIYLTLEAIHFLMRHEKLWDFNQMLDESIEDISVFTSYFEKLMSFVRIEFTNDGIKYSIAGSFADPVFVSMPWPTHTKVCCDCDGLDDSSDDEEDKTSNL